MIGLEKGKRRKVGNSSRVMAFESRNSVPRLITITVELHQLQSPGNTVFVTLIAFFT